MNLSEDALLFCELSRDAQGTHPGVRAPKTFQSCEFYIDPGDFIAQFFKVHSECLQNYRS